MGKNKPPTHCHACGHKPTAINRLAEAKDGKWVHKSHFVDPNSGYYRKEK